MLSQAGGMTSPWEYREVMAASVGYSDRRPEDVIADQRRRHAEATTERKAARKGGRPSTSAPSTTSDYSSIPKAALADLDRLRNRAVATE